jgi:hypothetical protein
MLPRHHQYYGPLRLPLRSPPLHVHHAYRVRRSQSTHKLAPCGSHRWGGDGPLLFPRWLSRRSTPSTPQGSSVLHFQALHTFRGLRHVDPGSAPCWPLSGVRFSTRQASLYAADRRFALSFRELDPALRRPGLPTRRRAATKGLGTSFGRTSTGKSSWTSRTHADAS